MKINFSLVKQPDREKKKRKKYLEAILEHFLKIGIRKKGFLK